MNQNKKATETTYREVGSAAALRQAQGDGLDGREAASEYTEMELNKLTEKIRGIACIVI